MSNVFSPFPIYFDDDEKSVVFRAKNGLSVPCVWNGKSKLRTNKRNPSTKCRGNEPNKQIPRIKWKENDSF